MYCDDSAFVCSKRRTPTNSSFWSRNDTFALGDATFGVLPMYVRISLVMQENSVGALVGRLPSLCT